MYLVDRSEYNNLDLLEKNKNICKIIEQLEINLQNSNMPFGLLIRQSENVAYYLNICTDKFQKNYINILKINKNKIDIIVQEKILKFKSRIYLRTKQYEKNILFSYSYDNLEFLNLDFILCFENTELKIQNSLIRVEPFIGNIEKLIK